MCTHVICGLKDYKYVYSGYDHSACHGSTSPAEPIKKLTQRFITTCALKFTVIHNLQILSMLEANYPEITHRAFLLNCKFI